MSAPGAPALVPGASPLRRAAPALLLAAAMATAYALGLHKYLKPNAILAERVWLAAEVTAHAGLAAGVYGLIYVAAAALSLPGAAALTIIGGLLFGWLTAGLITLVAATLGATMLFLAARSPLHDVLAPRAGKFLRKFEAGFQGDQAGYLLFLRLVPVFPFWLVNLAPALLGARLSTFVWTTFLGIAPGTFAFAWLGSSLGGIIDARAADCAAKALSLCPYSADLLALLTPQMQIAIGLLGLLALAPVVIKHVRARPNV